MPRKAAAELTAQYHHYSEQIKQALQQARSSAQAKAWEDVFRLADLLRRHERNRLATGDSCGDNPDLAAAWAALNPWPAGTQEVLSQRKQLDIDALRQKV